MTDEQAKAKIKETIGNTWFSFEEDRDSFSLRSREHGDISEEEPGKADIVEANRLIKLLREAGFKPRGEVIDEWVDVTIKKPEPKPWPRGSAPEGFTWVGNQLVRQVPQPATPYEKKQAAMFGRYSPVVGPKAQLP